MYCTNCGTQIPDGQAVCPNCNGTEKPSIPMQENNPVAQELITPVEINTTETPVQPKPAASEPVAQETPAAENFAASSGYSVPPQPQAEPEANYNNADFAPGNNFSAAPSYGANNANYASQQPTGAPVYQTFNQYQANQPKQVVTTGQWILRMLINLIPCVGPIIYFIMLFVWMNDKTKEDTSANWAKAQLIWMAISFGIVLLAYIIFFAIAGVTFNELSRELRYM